MWYLWVIWATAAMPLLGSSSSPWLWPHCQLTCLLPLYLFWCWTQQNPFHVSAIYIHFIYFFITHFKHLPVPMLNGILDPMMSVSSFYTVSSLLTSSLPLSLFLWLQPAELNIAAASLRESCRLHQIRLPSLYPITDGSSKLIQDLSRTNVTPCFCLKQIGPRSALTDTSTQNTWGEVFFAVALCSWKEREEKYISAADGAVLATNWGLKIWNKRWSASQDTDLCVWWTV